MADSSLLAAILSGQDPLSPQMLQAYQGSQLSNAAIDPAFGHNEGWGGALAKTIAGFRGGGMTQDAVNNVTQARIAAQPELARLLAGQDPYGALGANPDQFSPLARAALLNGATPGSVAEARLRAAQAAKEGLNLGGYQGTQALLQAGGTPQTGPVPGKMGGAVTGPATPRGSGDISTLTTGRPAAPSDASQPTDPLAGAGALSPQQRATILQNPQQRNIILQKLRALQTQRQASSVPALGRTAPPT